jgi:RimJ/RimL family protein N-acetyltransferase
VSALLIGENVRLRVATTEDAPLVSAWYGDPEYVGRFDDTWPRSSREWEGHLGAEQARDRGAFYLILRGDTDQPVGIATYWTPFTAPMFRTLELSYEVHPAARRNGIATQAACLLVNHLFMALPIERLQATIVVGNVASRRVLEKAGMQREGTLRRVAFVHGEHVDMHIFSILREGWNDERAYRDARDPF